MTSETRRRSSGSGGRGRGGSASVSTGSRASAPVTAIISRTEALTRLKEAEAVLARTDQGQGKPLEACVKAAAADELLRHPDREVRLWAAKCLAEALRIFAPEPPLDDQRLRAVLQLFLEQLLSLNDPTSHSYVHAFGLLERLTEIRGFMLLFVCPDPEELLANLVSTCLAAARGTGNEAAARLETQLAQLLTSILAEADDIPKTTLIALVEELMPRRCSSSAAGLVRRVLGGLANRSAALPINDFLNTSLYADSDPVDGEDVATEGSSKLSQDRLEALLCAIFELYVIEPSLVSRVIPNLHTDLQCPDPDRRRAVTALVGQMLSHYPQSGSGSHLSSSPRPPLALTHPLLVDRHRDRLGDADDGVRLTALEGCFSLLEAAAALKGAEREGLERSAVAHRSAMVAAAEACRERLAERSLDPNDAVRLRAVEIVAEIASQSEAGLSLLLPVLPEMFKRILDKKSRVREACAEAAARLYGKHALPAWMDGRYEDAQLLNWIPQLLCEAYSVFIGGRLGHVAQLEEYIEQHILGCGANLEAKQRAFALFGFYNSASKGPEAAVRGLALLFSRKREANAGLRNFLRLRIAKAAPLMEPHAATGSSALVPVTHDDTSTDQASAASLLEHLARMSPTLEDKMARPETLLVHLRALDAVRDKALWAQLDRLADLCIKDASQDMASLLGELDRLLRVHRLAELAPLLRRSLLSTWLLPDQVQTWLDVWAQSQRGDEVPDIVAAARQVLGEIPRYFPGAFLGYVKDISKFLATSPGDAYAALRALAAVGKRLTTLEGSKLGCALAADDFVNLLLKAIQLAGRDVTTRGAAARKSVKALLLLKEDAKNAMEQFLLWAEENASESEDSSLALHLAAACLERIDRSDNNPGSFSRKTWIETARKLVDATSQASSEVRCAAAELITAAGDEEEISALLSVPLPVIDVPSDAVVEEEVVVEVLVDPFPVHAACFALRSVRRGTVLLTTRLLSAIASRACACLAVGRPVSEAQRLLEALQGLQRPPAASQVRLADRLRLCTTLPTVFAIATLKRHRDPVQRMLQASLLKAARQCSTRQEPLLDFAVACFVHFLSRLDLFKLEATASASAFPVSSKISAFFCEALLRSDPHQAAELAGVALRVCDRVRYFVDREEPHSDLIHRAASVLRYVVEKRCPELGVQGAALLQGAARGSMPAELFAIRQGLERRTTPMPLQAAEDQDMAIGALVPTDLSTASPERSSQKSSLDNSQIKVTSPAAGSDTSPKMLTTPRRHQSLLKRGTGSASPAGVVAPLKSDTAEQSHVSVVSVARPMASISGGLSPGGVTGAAVMAALNAKANSKRPRTSTGSSQAKHRRTS